MVRAKDTNESVRANRRTGYLIGAVLGTAMVAGAYAQSDHARMRMNQVNPDVLVREGDTLRSPTELEVKAVEAYNVDPLHTNVGVVVEATHGAYVHPDGSYAGQGFAQQHDFYKVDALLKAKDAPSEYFVVKSDAADRRFNIGDMVSYEVRMKNPMDLTATTNADGSVSAIAHKYNVLETAALVTVPQSE